MRPAPPAVRSRPSWRSTSRCGGTCWTGSPVSSSPRTARRCAGPSCRGRVAGMGDGRIDGGPRPGARNRSLAACGSTSLTMRPCASAPKPSTRRCIVQSRGALRGELTACLCTGRALRVPRARSVEQLWKHRRGHVRVDVGWMDARGDRALNLRAQLRLGRLRNHVPAQALHVAPEIAIRVDEP